MELSRFMSSTVNLTAWIMMLIWCRKFSLCHVCCFKKVSPAYLFHVFHESIFIKLNSPTLNGNIGKSKLPYIWNGVSCYIQNLKIKNQWELQKQQVHATLLVSSGTSRTYKIKENNISFRPDNMCNWQKRVRICKILFIEISKELRFNILT